MVRKDDARIVEPAEDRSNVIQIILPHQTFMFDLDEEKEIGYMHEPSRYYEVEHFTRTGFIIPYEKLNIRCISTNEKKNLMLKPTEEKLSAVFTQFSELDLVELKSIS